MNLVLMPTFPYYTPYYLKNIVQKLRSQVKKLENNIVKISKVVGMDIIALCQTDKRMKCLQSMKMILEEKMKTSYYHAKSSFLLDQVTDTIFEIKH